MPDVKRYDAMTRTDRYGRMVGHCCVGDTPCFHCKAGVPFEVPRDLSLAHDTLLAVIEQRLIQQIVDTTNVLTAIRSERSARGSADA